MSKEKLGNEPANPVFFRYQDGNVGNELYEKGLTKREIFAMSAMNGMLANHEISSIFNANNGMPVPYSIAEYSVKYADALLLELNKE